MKIRFTYLFLATAVAAISLIACKGNWFGISLNDYKYKFEDSFAEDLEGADTVVIEIEKGDITVETWDQDRIEIDIHERIKARNKDKAEELATTVKFVSKREDSKLIVKPDFGDFFNLRDNYYSALEIRIPKNLSLKLDTTHGDITVPEMSGWVEIISTHGDINLAGCGGYAEIESTHGKIIVENVAGKLSAQTTHDDIRIRNVNGEVRAESTHGDIDLRGCENAINLETTHGSIIIEDASNKVIAYTTYGEIDLKVDENTGFSIKAKTSYDEIRATLPDDNFDADYNRDRTRLEGKYLDGKYQVTLETTHGSISIKAF